MDHYMEAVAALEAAETQEELDLDAITEQQLPPLYLPPGSLQPLVETRKVMVLCNHSNESTHQSQDRESWACTLKLQAPLLPLNGIICTFLENLERDLRDALQV